MKARKQPKLTKFKIADLFAGTGAFSLAFKNTNKADIIFANDIEPNSKLIYDMNLDHKLILGDISQIKASDIPKFDILTGGFPCQAFSIAGKQEGFKDPRGNLFLEIIRIAKFHKPKCLILENVKNLQSHDNSNTYQVIKSKLEEIGYVVLTKILDSSKIANTPQHRERIYLICFLDKNKASYFKFPEEIARTKQISDILDANISPKYYYGEKLAVWDKIQDKITNTAQENAVYQYRRNFIRENKNNLCPTLTANMGSGGHNIPIIRDNLGIRKLTPRECFRLQSFPDSYKFPDISDSGLYKLVGNAVTYEVVKKIILEVIRVFELDL